MQSNLFRLVSIALLAIATAAFVGAQSTSSQTTPGQASPSGQYPSTQSGTSGQTATPSSTGGIQAQIQKDFQQDTNLSRSGVSANVSESKVELTGTVASQADKDKAQSIAESDAGGRKVVNNITVSGSETSTPKK